MFGIIRMPRFIRRFIRRRTSHMPPQRALEVKEKISIAYAFVAWNLFGIIAYNVYTGKWEKVEKKDEVPLSQGRQFVKMLKLDNVTLHQVRGLTYVRKADLNEENLLETDVIDGEKEPVQEELSSNIQ